MKPFLAKWMPWSGLSKKSTHQRSSSLDLYRGLAVLLMIIFHLCWDLREFDYIDYSLRDPFWVGFRSLIISLFMSALGWSCYLSCRNGFQWPSILKRKFKLFLAAGGISLATYLAFPQNWIFFGILHFIFVASWLVLPVARKPWLSLAIGIGILLAYFGSDTLNAFSLHTYLTSEFGLPKRTLDIVNLLPWLGVVFIGPIMGHLKLHTLKLPYYLNSRVLTFLGKHALPVYLCHQLLLYSLIALVTSLIR
ncbi:heparan-alpha-glucosaminide N-acetyltransferase [Marinomonas sp. MED121]|uniref:heparan-alpha-glucosaminide N-acetyltransferase n=1 Tax=Marinomonas sp. MED121 TaxID=314277 RepID=UPI0002EC7BDD|nr:heparan-alpha-glucosaminide N-acetyltransferase [Marinomonas sp. MED121]